MRINTKQTSIWICLLICSLLLTCYTGIFSPGSVVLTDVNTYSNNGSSENWSMTGPTDLWQVDYLAITDISTPFFISSMKHSPGPSTRTIFNILFLLITAQIICLAYSSRLAGSICSQFSSIGITLFLHKKDGMK